jgi:DNA-binding NtrC family response regulator
LPLANHYLEVFGQKYQRGVGGFDASASRALMAYDWPGNVRELSHAVERSVLMARTECIGAADLALGPEPTVGRAEDMTLEQAERVFIEKVIARHGGDIPKAAEQLGMSRSALYRRLQQFNASNPGKQLS